MIVSNGYSIMQDVNNNRIVINLPQTINSITSTVIPFSGRRRTITAEEESCLLHIIIAMYEGKCEIGRAHV